MVCEDSVSIYTTIITSVFTLPTAAYAEEPPLFPIVPYSLGSTEVYELDDLIDNAYDAGRYYKISVDKKMDVSFFVCAEWDDTAAGLYDSNFDAIWNVTGDGTEGYNFTKPWIYDPSQSIYKYYYGTTTTLNAGTYYVGFVNLDGTYYTNSWIGLTTEIESTECQVSNWHKNVKISGTQKVGKKLTAKYKKAKAVTGIKYTYSYKWYANGKVIKGATKSTYKIAQKYKGQKISVKVTCTAKVTDSKKYKLVGKSTKTITSKKTKKIR